MAGPRYSQGDSVHIFLRHPSGSGIVIRETKANVTEKLGMLRVQGNGVNFGRNGNRVPDKCHRRKGG